jgi:hypothetical protein
MNHKFREEKGKGKIGSMGIQGVHPYVRMT